MQYNAAERNFEISIRMFTDDLEKALSREVGQPVRLSVKDNHDAKVEAYLRKNFTFVNPRKQPRPYRYIGKEAEGDATWIYIEIPYNEPLSGSVLRQQVLMDIFDDQVNVVNVQYQSERKTYLFKKDQPIHVIN